THRPTPSCGRCSTPQSPATSKPASYGLERPRTERLGRRRTAYPLSAMRRESARVFPLQGLIEPQRTYFSWSRSVLRAASRAAHLSHQGSSTLLPIASFWKNE